MMGYAGMSIFVRSPPNGILQHSRLGKGDCHVWHWYSSSRHFSFVFHPKDANSILFFNYSTTSIQLLSIKAIDFQPTIAIFWPFPIAKAPFFHLPPEKKTHHHRIFCLEPSLFVCSKHHSPWETLRVVLLAVKTALEVRCWPLDMLSNEPHWPTPM